MGWVGGETNRCFSVLQEGKGKKKKDYEGLRQDLQAWREKRGEGRREEGGEGRREGGGRREEML